MANTSFALPLASVFSRTYLRWNSDTTWGRRFLLFTCHSYWTKRSSVWPSFLLPCMGLHMTSKEEASRGKAYEETGQKSMGETRKAEWLKTSEPLRAMWNGLSSFIMNSALDKMMGRNYALNYMPPPPFFLMMHRTSSRASRIPSTWMEGLGGQVFSVTCPQNARRFSWQICACRLGRVRLHPLQIWDASGTGMVCFFSVILHGRRRPTTHPWKTCSREHHDLCTN